MSVGSLTIGGTAITTWARHAYITRYASGARRGRNLIIPNRDGEYSAPTKYFTPTDLLLQVAFKRSTTVLENLSDLLAALTDPVGLVTIAGSSTFHGSVQTAVELLREPTPLGADDPSVYTFILRTPSGVWESGGSADSNAGNPPAVTTTGDRPIGDAILTFAAAGYLEHTMSDGTTSRITLESGVPASTIVDCGARTVSKTGTDYDNKLTLTGTNPERWLRMEANLSQTFTSNVSVTVARRDKWAI